MQLTFVMSVESGDYSLKSFTLHIVKLNFYEVKLLSSNYLRLPGRQRVNNYYSSGNFFYNRFTKRKFCLN